MTVVVKTFFDEKTNNATHVVRDAGGSACVLIDTVLGFDLAAGRTFTEPADRIASHVEAEGLQVEWILETHVHADHVTAAPYLKERLGGRLGIGVGVTTVQNTFADIYNAEPGFDRDGSQFDRLFEDGDRFEFGSVEGRVIHTPGHTPACVTYIIEDAAFSGDTFFMPDSGTARCDFPGGSAAELYRSLRKIMALPEETRLFVNHDYGADDSRDFAWETTVGEQKEKNIHVGGDTGEKNFIAMREARDATLSVPRLMLPAIQINMRAGNLPPPESNGTRYLKIPLNLFGG